MNATTLSIGLSVLGNFLNAVGYIIEKKAHMNIMKYNKTAPLDKQKSFVKTKLWIFGFLVYTFGSILHAIALAYGPASLLSCLEAVTLISNTYLAHKFLQEPLRNQDIIATILVVIGCTACALFGPDLSSLEIDLEELYHSFHHMSTQFTIFFFILTGFTIFLYIIVKIIEKKNKKISETVNPKDNIDSNYSYGGISDIDKSDNHIDEDDSIQSFEFRFASLAPRRKFTNVTALSLLVSLVTNNDNNRPDNEVYIHGTALLFLYPTVAAYFGSCNILLTKAVGEIAVVTAQDVSEGIDPWEHVFVSWIPYTLIILLIIANISMEYWKQKALAKFDAMYVIPIYQVELIIGGILFGAIYFDELSILNQERLALFLTAIVINLIGVSILGIQSFRCLCCKKKKNNKEIQPLALFPSGVYDEYQDPSMVAYWFHDSD
eukprot:49999_1